MAGGYFTNIGGQTRNYIARLDPTTGLADSFNPNASAHNIFNPSVTSIVLQADGKTLVAGNFDTLTPNGGGAIIRYGLARLNPDGTVDPTFDSGRILFPAGTTGLGPLGVALQTDGKILVGGDFTFIGGQSRNGFARLTNDTAALQLLIVRQNSITFTRDGASPQFTRVTFESSPDNVNFTFLGNGTAAGSDWTLTGLNLPIGQNLVIRARGFYGSGDDNGSGSVTGTRRGKQLTAQPVIEKITARPRILWPPNNQLASVKVNVEASDDTDSHLKCKIVSVTFVDPKNGDDDEEDGKKMRPAFQITGDLTVDLRAGPQRTHLSSYRAMHGRIGPCGDGIRYREGRARRR